MRLARRPGVSTCVLFCYNEGCDAGWSSLVARRAHNPKVAGSNPAPAIAADQGVGLEGALQTGRPRPRGPSEWAALVVYAGHDRALRGKGPPEGCRHQPQAEGNCVAARRDGRSPEAKQRAE